MIKILCLSDLHYSASKNKGVYTNDSGIEMKKPIGKDELNILLSSIKENGQIDLLIICGDIVVGGDSDEQKKESLDDIKKFITEIVESAEIFATNITHPWERVIYVPGNHDVDRNNSDGIYKGISDLFSKAFSPMYNDSCVQPHAPVFVFDELRLIVSAISTVENSNSGNKKIREVLDIAEQLSVTNKEQADKIKNLLKDYAQNDIPSITSLTTSKFINNSNIISEIDKYKDYKKIILTHHPLLSGITSGIDLKKYNDTVGGYGFMKTAIEYGYNFFIHGHLHSTSCVEIIDHLSEGKSQVIQLGLPKTEIDKDDGGCVLIEIADENSAFPFKCTLLKPDSIAWRFKQIPLINYNERPKVTTENDHILVDYEISKLIGEDTIVKHGDLNNVEAASYDCSLGNEYKKGSSRFCNWEEVEISTIKSGSDGPGKIYLKPNETVLIFSHEEFNIPDDMVLHASPISSWLRKGIKFDISFFVDPGFVGKFSIPVTNESDKTITIDAQKPIISLEFIKLSRSCRDGWGKRHKDFADLRADMRE